MLPIAHWAGGHSLINTLDPSSLTIHEPAVVLGVGSHGEVKAGVLVKRHGVRHVRHEVAVKALPFHTPAEREKCKREVEIMWHGKQHIQGVCRLHGTMEKLGGEGGKRALLFIVMKRYHGTLETRLTEPVSIEQAVDITKQVSSTISELHEQNIIVRDLKPSNILCDDKQSCFVADFGISELMQANATHHTTKGIQGTPYYMAPEQLDPSLVNNRISCKADVWGLGCILLQCVTGHPPWPKDLLLPGIIRRVVCNKEKPDIPDSCPEEVAKIIQACFSYVPGDRPNARDVYENLNNLTWNASLTGGNAAAKSVETVGRPSQISFMLPTYLTVMGVLAVIIAIILAGPLGPGQDDRTMQRCAADRSTCAGAFESAPFADGDGCWHNENGIWCPDRDGGWSEQQTPSHAHHATQGWWPGNGSGGGRWGRGEVQKVQGVASEMKRGDEEAARVAAVKAADDEAAHAISIEEEAARVKAAKVEAAREEQAAGANSTDEEVARVAAVRAAVEDDAPPGGRYLHSMKGHVRSSMEHLSNQLGTEKAAQALKHVEMFLSVARMVL